MKERLANGRQVLFSGTPCQVAGLKSFLKTDDPNLICADIICHGVPSEKVWRKYIEYQENRMKGAVRRVNFRDKAQGWSDFSMKLKCDDENESCVVHQQDLYMQAFLKDCCLRKSCYRCRFKTLHRTSDLTMADLWGFEHFVPEWNDDKGISLLLIHSDKGRALFQAVKKDCCFQRIEAREAVKYNKNAIASATPHPNRGKFFQKLDALPLDELTRKYGKRPVPIKVRLNRAKRRLLRRAKAALVRGRKRSAPGG